MPTQKYTVLVDDNFHYQDESERYKLGVFDDLDAAIAACKRVVDDYLDSVREPGIETEAMYQSYTMFGDDPFIVGAEEAVPFSAWSYARRRCEEICGDQTKEVR